MVNRGFKEGDPVAVFYGDRVKQGRVIATGRDNKYGLSVVILVENRDIETFREDGTRGFGSSVSMRKGRA